MPPFSDNMLYSQLAQDYAPLVAGRPHDPISGMESLPLIGQGQAFDNPMLRLATSMFVTPALQEAGFIPFGSGHDRNFYDVIRNRQYEQVRQEVLRRSTRSDRASYEATLQGAARVAGIPWGSEQQQFASDFGTVLSSIAPMASQIAPELMDRLAGPRGSALVMSQGLLAANRYRNDPVTGRRGFSAASTIEQTDELARILGSEASLAEVHGLSMGRFGQLYDELTRRGMLGRRGDVNSETRNALRSLRDTDPTAFRELAGSRGLDATSDFSQLSGEELKELRGLDSVQGQMRKIDTQRISQTLKGYAEAIAAVKDIFGDMGQPNTPMSELLKNLDAMTQGGVGRIDPSTLARIARTGYETAKQSGVSMDTYGMLQQHAAARASQYGLDPIVGTLVNQQSVLFNSTYRANGWGQTPAWGRYNADQLLQADSNLRNSAAASEHSRRAATLLRLRETVGGFAEGSEVEKIAQAALAGDMPEMTNADFAKLLQTARGRAGEDLHVSEGQAYRMLDQHHENQEFLVKNEQIVNDSRKKQARDYRRFMSQNYSGAIADSLRSAGVSQGDAQSAASQIADSVAAEVAQIDPSVFANNEERTKKIAEIMQKHLSGTAAGRQLEASGEMTAGFTRQMAGAAYSRNNQAIRGGKLAADYGDAQNAHVLNHPELFESYERQQQQVQLDSRVAASLTSLGQDSALRRVIGELQGTDNNADLQSIIAKGLGTVASEEVQALLSPELLKIREQLKDLDSSREDLAAETDPNARAAILARQQERDKQLQESVAALQDMLKAQGIETEATSPAPSEKQEVDKEETHRVSSARRGLVIAKIKAHYQQVDEDRKARGLPPLPNANLPSMMRATEDGLELANEINLGVAGSDEQQTGVLPQLREKPEDATSAAFPSVIHLEGRLQIDSNGVAVIRGEGRPQTSSRGPQ